MEKADCVFNSVSLEFTPVECRDCLPTPPPLLLARETASLLYIRPARPSLHLSTGETSKTFVYSDTSVLSGAPVSYWVRETGVNDHFFN